MAGDRNDFEWEGIVSSFAIQHRRETIADALPWRPRETPLQRACKRLRGARPSAPAGILQPEANAALGMPSTSSGRPSTFLHQRLRALTLEKSDDDIRNEAMRKLKAFILLDPEATDLGDTLLDGLGRLKPPEEVAQTFLDSFAAKASSTLQKRANSLTKLTHFAKTALQVSPLRLTEPQLYAYLRWMETKGLGATAASHALEALRFIDGVARLRAVNLQQIVSPRCLGVARKLFLTKQPLNQKDHLSAGMVRALEGRMMACKDSARLSILGQLLFCAHACCRWKDAQRLCEVTHTKAAGISLLEASALRSKTSTTKETQTRFMPYVALGSTGEPVGSKPEPYSAGTGPRRSSCLVHENPAVGGQADGSK